MHRIPCALVLVALVLNQQAVAGPAASEGNTLTLAEALRLARDRSPVLAAGSARRNATVGATRQAGAWQNPDLEISSEDVSLRGDAWNSSKTLLGIAQTFPGIGKQRLAVQAAQLATGVEEAALALAERELTRDVKSAFITLLAAGRREGALSDLLALEESLVASARKRVAAGATARQEVVRAEIETERVQMELAAAQRAVAAARRDLALLLGCRPEGLEAAGTLGEAFAPVDTAVLRTNLLASHPAIRVAHMQEERAHVECERARIETRPDVTIGLAAGHDAASDENVFELRASVPLPLSGRLQGRRQEAASLREASAHERQALEQQLLRQLTSTVERYETARLRVEGIRLRVLPRTDEALRLVRGGFDAGKFGFLDLVDTQRTAAESRLEYLDKLLELNLAASELEALAGVELPE